MVIKTCKKCVGGHFNRRDFLRVGSLSFLGVNLTQFLQLRRALAAEESVFKAKAQACILVWLDGGPPQMDTFDPKPSSAFKPISTNVDGIQFSELLPKLAQRMDKLALVRSMHTGENNHLQGTHFVATGHSPNPAMKFPSFSSIITKELGQRGSIPPNVMVPAMPKGKLYDEVFKGHIISPAHDPLIIPDPNAAPPDGLIYNDEDLKPYEIPDLSLPKGLSHNRIDDRLSMLKMVDGFFRNRLEKAEFSAMDTFTEQALKMIVTPEVRSAFDLSQETEQTRQAYGRDTVGQSMLLARRLVEAGSRFVTAGGYAAQAWDTHDTNDTKMRDTLGPTLDRSLSALIDDLDQRGMLDSTIVMVMGEFGRTADLNIGGGRDHWPECWTAMLAGGGIRGGQVVGASDERGAYVADRMVTMGDLYATLYKAMGIDWNKTYMHPIGRPVKIANSNNDETGEPLHELV